MATKGVNLAAYGGSHTSGIFSDMTVDGPIIGTLVVIMDRARNLPNKRSMGKQDPYCAARLGKEAKKTKTDKRGGQTPRWDQELRFTVHDSPDYHRLKVSVFNDDKKTELIGETWVNLESVIMPGGGTHDEWHGLNNKGKYAGEIRLEFTYYDTRPKAEKSVVEKKREPTRYEGQTSSLNGPRDSTPVKRRPLPLDPTGASPSPVNTPEHRGLRGLRSGPRELGSPRHQQAVEAANRRPMPDASPLNSTLVAAHHTPKIRQALNPRPSNPNIPLNREESFDMSYAAPKPYEIQALTASSQHAKEPSHRTMSQDDFRSSQGHLPLLPAEPIHAHSAPMVPTQHSYEQEIHQHRDLHADACTNAHPSIHAQEAYQDPAMQVAPLRTRRSREYREEQTHEVDPYYGNRYIEAPPEHDLGSARMRSAMQPMVEDEDDLPPPPPVHRRDANTIPHPMQDEPHSYTDEFPESLAVSHYRQEPAQIGYELQYASDQFDHPPQPERSMTYPGAIDYHTSERSVSRDSMARSPLRQEIALPSSLIAGHNPAREKRNSVGYQTLPAYETPPQLRHYSEPAEYRAITEYEENPVESQALVHHSSFQVSQSPYDYPHDPPELPCRTSPPYDSAPLVKPRATSPGFTPSPHDSPNPVTERNARGPSRTMPTRKSVSPRPPPKEDESGERRLSGIAFNPDSFDVYNPRASRSPVSGMDDERPGSSMEMNDKGQIVTFNGRVVDASDHLPVDAWAPEPTPKGTVKDKPFRPRVQLNGTRDLEAAREREEKYRTERAQRDRIRHAASETFDSTPSTALVTTRHNFDAPYDNSGALVLASSANRDRLQKYHQQHRSYGNSPQQHTSSDSHILRERHNPNSYGMSPGYERNSISGRAPAIPAKVPLGEEDMALSLELQSIDIGPGSGGRRPRAQGRKQYGY